MFLKYGSTQNLYKKIFEKIEIILLNNIKEIPKKIARKENKVSVDGCGSMLHDYDFHFDFDKIKLTGFNDCCNKHDVCYGTCNEQKNECDSTFKECLFDRCDELGRKNLAIKSYVAICKEAAQAMFISVVKLGCPAYGKAQKHECVC